MFEHERHHSDLHKQRIAASLTGRTLSEATKEKMRQSALKREYNKQAQMVLNEIEETQTVEPAERKVMPVETSHETKQEENKVRPQDLKHFTGPSDLKKQIEIMLEGAKILKKPVDHCLIVGQPGTGKSSLAQVIVNEAKQRIGTEVKVVSCFGSMMKEPKDLLRVFQQFSWQGCDEKGRLQPGVQPALNFLLLDEAHLVKRPENFYQALTDFTVAINTVDSYDGLEKTVTRRIPPWCLIAIGDRAGELSVPFLERLRYTFQLESYSVPDLVNILQLAAQQLQVRVTPEALTLLAEHSKKIPRIAISYLIKCRNLQVCEPETVINEELVKRVFKLIGVFANGLVRDDIKAITYVQRVWPQKVGLARIAMLCGHTIKSALNSLMPFLESEEYLITTPGGRTLGRNGKKYLEDNHLIVKETEDEITKLEAKSF